MVEDGVDGFQHRQVKPQYTGKGMGDFRDLDTFGDLERGANGNPVDIRGPFAEALAGTTGQLLGVGRLDDELSFNVLINALQADDSANILSTPSLLTLDNEEAVITVGRNVPFVTGQFTKVIWEGLQGQSGNPDYGVRSIELVE